MNFNRFKNRTIQPEIKAGKHTAYLKDIIEDTDSKDRTIQKLVWVLTDCDNRVFTEVRNDTLASGKTYTAFDNAVARIRRQLNLQDATVNLQELFENLVNNKTIINLWLTKNEVYDNFDVDYLEPIAAENNAAEYTPF